MIPVIVWTAQDVSHAERSRLLALAQGIVLKGEGAQALLDEVQGLVMTLPGAPDAG
jgi:hypothetical protein